MESHSEATSLGRPGPGPEFKPRTLRLRGLQRLPKRELPIGNCSELTQRLGVFTLLCTEVGH
jgi:hypothetical protein